MESTHAHYLSNKQTKTFTLGKTWNGAQPGFRSWQFHYVKHFLDTQPPPHVGMNVEHKLNNSLHKWTSLEKKKKQQLLKFSAE